MNLTLLKVYLFAAKKSGIHYFDILKNVPRFPVPRFPHSHLSAMLRRKAAPRWLWITPQRNDYGVEEMKRIFKQRADLSNTP